MEVLALGATINSLGAILDRGCQPTGLALRLNPKDGDADARGVAALSCLSNAGVSTVTNLYAVHFALTAPAATALAAAAPVLACLSLTDCPRLEALPLLLSSVLICSHLRCLVLERCDGWPEDAAALASALASCGRLEHLTLQLIDPTAADVAAVAAAVAASCCDSAPLSSIGRGRGGGGGRGRSKAAAEAREEGAGSRSTVEQAARQEAQELARNMNRQYGLAAACAAAAVVALTRLRSLSLDLRLPSYDVGPYTDAADPAATGTAAATQLAAGLTALSRLTRLELDEGGSVPHPAWRLALLTSVASLPGLAELGWRRLEIDREAAAALAHSTSLTSLSVEKFRPPAGVKAVALAAAAAAKAVVVMDAAAGGGDDGGGGWTTAGPMTTAAAAAARAAAAAANVAAVAAFPEAVAANAAAAATAAACGAPPPPPLWTQLLLPLPAGLQQLRARYSGLGGMSLAALAALQLPRGLRCLELRNPKLEIGDGDVDQPDGLRLLPEAALALGLGLHKLAEACPGLATLRVISEARQRNALAPPSGWGEDGGADGGGGGTGGGHAPWLTALGGLRGLRRLTLSGLQLGRVDAEVLARHATALEELYLVPLSSISSAAVPALRAMPLRRLVLPYERHA